MPRTRELEIEQDMAWQHRAWRVQRCGWAVLLAFLAAAAIGVFGGDGPLREAEAGAASTVSYDRFSRFGSPTELEVAPTSADVADAEVEIAIDADYWSDFRVDAITPEPDAVRAVGGEIVYTFLSGAEPEQVSFRLTPLEAGVQKGRLRVGGGGETRFTQIIYP